MNYLKINKKFRIFLAVIGFITLIYGVWDLASGEAGRKGLNSTKEEQPISYYLTVGKKILIGSGLLLIALSPLLGTEQSIREEKSS